jgi:hypothetical protein
LLSAHEKLPASSLIDITMIPAQNTSLTRRIRNGRNIMKRLEEKKIDW